MLRQPVPLISVGLRYKALPLFPRARLMRCLATASSRTAAAFGSAVNQAAAGIRIAKIPLMVMALLASPFAWSSEPTAANRVTFTSLDQVTRVAIATDGQVQYRAIGRLQNPDRLYYDLLGPNLQTHGNRTVAILVADHLLKRVRISHREGGIMRVVLDLRRPVQVVASQIPNPDRLMIELRPATPDTLPSLLATHSQQRFETNSKAPVVQSLQPPEPFVIPRTVKEAKQRSIAAVARKLIEPTGQGSYIYVRSQTAKLKLAPDPPQVQVIKPASQPSPQLAQPAKQNRDDARLLIWASGPKVGRLILEARHGGDDTGATSRTSFTEKELVLDVARRLGTLIGKQLNSEVIYTRSNDTFVPLEERPALATEKDVDLKSQLSVSRLAVMQATQRSIAAVARKPIEPTGQNSHVSVRSQTAKLKLAPDPPRVQVIKPAAKPSPLLAQPAKLNRGDARSLTRALGLKVSRVVLDPGHGGDDTGATSRTGLTEKELVLDVARRLGSLIEKQSNSEVIYTRSNDTFVPLEERPALAKERDADLFVSIHANWSAARSAIGSETYYLNFSNTEASLDVAARENALSKKSVHELQDLIHRIAFSEKVNESREFAASVQSSLYSSLSIDNREEKSRGVKQAPFVVLVGSRVPSILVEIGFLSNPQEENLLKRSDHRQRIADALYKGMAQYMNRLSHIDIAQRD